MISGIYKIENLLSGKLYIGSAVNLDNRLKHHRSRLRSGVHKNRHLQSAWNREGESLFAFETLLFCSREQLMFYEQRCIDGFDAVNSGYNIDPIAGKTVGRVPNAESVLKMAATKRGRQMSQSSRDAIRIAMNRPEVRAKLATSCKAAFRKPKTAEHIRNAANALRGRSVSTETRLKIAAANLGKKNGPHSAETRAKISVANKGRSLSAQHVAALRGAWERRKQLNGLT
jgi:group I intron endonuclease